MVWEQGDSYMEQFFTDDDLFDILEELDQEQVEISEDEAEMEASNRRYREIIQKHKMDWKEVPELWIHDSGTFNIPGHK